MSTSHEASATRALGTTAGSRASQPSKVCVVGSFMMDLVASAPRRPKSGETVIGSDFATFVGGKGFNQAVAAARAGAETTMLGRLGNDDFGRTFRAAMAEEGVDSSAVATDDNHGTGVGLPVLEPDGQNSIIVVPRANWAVTPGHIRENSAVVEDADVVLLQLELPVPTIVEASKIARAAGTFVVLNPAPFTPIDDLRGLVDVIVPNEVELAAIAVGAGSSALASVASAVYSDWNADLVATLGSDGVMVVTNGGRIDQFPAHYVEAVDTIGAGDTFCGYLAEALASGASLPDAARRANAAAAISVTRRGAGNSAPRPQEVDDLIAHSSDQNGAFADVIGGKATKQ